MSSNTPDNNTELAETPEGKFNMTGRDGNHIGISEWCDYYDVYGWLLPFPHPRYRPIEIGQLITEEIAEMPATAGTFTLSTIGINMTDELAQVVNPNLWAHRIVKKPGDETPSRYYNPDWVHYDACATPISYGRNTVDFYTAYADVGLVTPQWLADHLDMDTDQLNRVTQINTEFESTWEHIRDSRRRVARSIYTATVWEDECTVGDMAAALGVSEAIVKNWVTLWVENTAWKPPECPSEYDWFPHTHPHPDTVEEQILL